MTNPTIPIKSDKITDHLANERTFLAWIRTSISIIIFGFVVSKFGITLRQLLLIQNHAIKEGGASLYIGVGFIVIGVIMALLAMTQYKKNMHSIDIDQFKPSNTIVVILGLTTIGFGVIMISYLLIGLV